jgi:hypothetical protein
MHVLRTILLVVHISAAAIALGTSTGLLRNLRRCLGAGKNAFALAAEDAQRRGKFMTASSVATLWTGVALIFTLGGFKAVPLNIHIAMSIMLVAIGVSLTIMRPTSAALLTLSRADVLDKEAVSKKLKRLVMGQGILHLCWLTILVLMLVRIEK